MPPTFAITTDEELETASRDKTSYDVEELPGAHSSGQMQGLIQDAKRVLYVRTGSDKWYTDTAYGQALVALTALKMKEAVENVNISSYGIGNESVSFNNADPEDSQQIVAWSDELNSMLAKSDLDFPNRQDHGFKNTASYIG